MSRLVQDRWQVCTCDGLGVGLGNGLSNSAIMRGGSHGLSRAALPGVGSVQGGIDGQGVALAVVQV